MHNGVAQNKENAVLSSAARTGKTGLLNAKSSISLHPSKTAGKSQKIFGSPHPSPISSVLTPSGKKPAKKSLVRPALRSQAQTPSSKVCQHPLSVVQEQAPKTIKRRQGLFFSSRTQVRTDESLKLLEPEYAPPRSASPAFDAKGHFGFDLDISLVPITQLSNSGSLLKELPPLDLEFEKLVDIPVSPPSNRQKSSIPRSSLVPSFDFIACKPQLLVANSLMPSRIPQLKRKRKL
ncbi:hypothetical protein J3B02_000769 [Coemansia erecta]|nr:hypothetical protein J3B02_000769 [Coemansia erecta]